MADSVKYELNETVATITLDDGKVNVLGPAMQSAINEALDKAEKDSAKAVVIAGNQRVFSGGFDLAVFGSGDRITVRAGDGEQPLEAIVLGGQPIREPVAHYGPFVMNTREELQQAMDDFRAGKLGVIPPNALMPHVYRG